MGYSKRNRSDSFLFSVSFIFISPNAREQTMTLSFPYCSPKTPPKYDSHRDIRISHLTCVFLSSFQAPAILGSVRRLLFQQKKVSEAEIREAETKIERAIHRRLLRVELPGRCSVSLCHGWLFVRVDGEFEASLSLPEDSDDAPWSIIDLSLLSPPHSTPSTTSSPSHPFWGISRLRERDWSTLKTNQKDALLSLLQHRIFTSSQVLDLFSFLFEVFLPYNSLFV